MIPSSFLFFLLLVSTSFATPSHVSNLFGTCVGDHCDSEQPEVLRYLSWLKENGANVQHITIEKYVEPGAGQTPFVAWIVKTNTQLAPGEVVFSIPPDLIFSIHNTKRKSEECKEITDLYAYFYCESHNPKSFWKPFFELLPKSFSESHPFFWSTSELTALYGTHALQVLMKLKAELKKDWTEGNFQFSLDDYYSVYTLFHTRGLHYQFLIPVLTELNPRRYLNLLPNSLPTPSMLRSSSPFNFIAQEAFLPGAEIPAYHDKSLSGSLFINTGSVYRLHYTFLLDPQPSDGFTIYLTLDSIISEEEDPLYSKKKNALRWYGWEKSGEKFDSSVVENGESFNILATRIDQDLRTWLRIVVIKDQQEWDKHGLSEKFPKGQLSDSNEREVFETISKFCMLQLSQSKTTLVEDYDALVQLHTAQPVDEESELKELMKKDVTTEAELQKLMKLLGKKQKKDEPKDPEQERREKQIESRAIMYRMSEKRALLGTLSMAQQQLAKLGSKAEFMSQIDSHFVGLRTPYVNLGK